MSVLFAAMAGSLFALGVYLLLQRQLSRMIIGLAVVGTGANIVLLTSAGGRGVPDFVDASGRAPADAADPLPQAMILTAIVISFAAIAFLLAMAYRGWALSGHDEVEDDIEDRMIASRKGASEDYDDMEIALLTENEREGDDWR